MGVFKFFKLYKRYQIMQSVSFIQSILDQNGLDKV